MSRYQIVKDGTQATVVMEGDLTAALVPELKPLLKQLIDEGTKQLAFDLSRTGLVDSSGIGLLIAAHNSMGKSGGRLVVTGASPEIVHLFKTMRLDRHFGMAGGDPR